MDNLREGLDLVVRCLPKDFSDMHAYMKCHDFTLLTVERLEGRVARLWPTYHYTC